MYKNIQTFLLPMSEWTPQVSLVVVHNKQGTYTQGTHKTLFIGFFQVPNFLLVWINCQRSFWFGNEYASSYLLLVKIYS